jgi:2-hydroxychromene-2-carboxylate isomerase
MPTGKLRCYFAYNSPYAFLANTRLEMELASLDVEIEYKPIYSPRRPGGPEPDPRKLRYLFEDVGRFAKAYGLDMKPGPIADTRKACLGFLFAQEQGRGKTYHDAVYEARFLQARDIGSEETLAEIAVRVGFEREAFLKALEDKRYAAALEASNRHAEEDEVFGVPFFVYENQRFWGNDRIEWLIREIRQRL